MIYWDDDGNKQELDLKEEGDYFDLPPNSIAFVTLQPVFSIPIYMALRFNLKITHIYKGLLLGTGPLVDPGFSGRLSIPLHNLTGNTYRFFKGDELITMEFTKMSKNALWREDEINVGHDEKYIENNIKSGRDVNAYVAKALKKDRLGKVISSIPSTMLESKQAIAEAKQTIDEMHQAASVARKWSTVFNIAGFVGLLTLILSAMGFAFTSYEASNARYAELLEKSQREQLEYNKELKDLTDEVDTLQQEIISLRGIK